MQVPRGLKPISANLSKIPSGLPTNRPKLPARLHADGQPKTLLSNLRTACETE